MSGKNIFHPSRRLSLIRQLSLIFVVALVLFIAYQHQIVGGGPQGIAPIDSYCPFGGVETLWLYLTQGQFLQKINWSNFVLLYATLIVTVVAGSSFCGWLCPFGALQEWLAKLGKGIFGRTFVPSASWDKWLRPLRFAVLAGILYMTVQTGKLWFETYDPYKVLFHLQWETTTALVIAGLTVVVSILSERFWCRYLCPLGAVYSIFSPLSFFKLKRNPDTCTQCNLCSKTCDMGIDVAKLEKIPDGQCSRCLECVTRCPHPGTLELEGFWGKKSGRKQSGDRPVQQ